MFSVADGMAIRLSAELAGVSTALLLLVGTPIAWWLARTQSREPMRVTVLGSLRHEGFTSGGVELFDMAAQGRIDAFFLGGGQIDGQANINLVGTGAYPNNEVRWPGCFGSSYLYFLVPRVILFREEHSRRVMVPKVDFISAPGSSEPGVHRCAGPYALLTELGLFFFERERRRFRLDSVHPGRSVQEIRENTGFQFDCPERVPVTAPPDSGTLSAIRDTVRGDIAEAYPRFAAGLQAA